ncbi:MAG: hypothetical protein JWL75_662 [Parcubacteria group bacterium]|nr:hypothetical protein [Parcubacteria group bacterium]
MKKYSNVAIGLVVLLILIVPIAHAATFSANTSFTVGGVSSSTPAFTVADTGLVGIGSGTPTSSLFVQGSMPAIAIKKSLINQEWQLRTGGASQFAASFDLYNASAKKTALYVSTDGNLTVGSSTSNINSRLYVWGGPTGANVDVRGDSTIYGGDQATIELEGSNYDDMPNSALLQYYGEHAVGSTMGFPNNRLGHIQFGQATVGIIHTDNSAPLVLGTNSLERMRITGNGLVGIGITNPVSPFQVVAATSTATTTITVGDLTNTASKSCVNMKSASGNPVSFYFDAGGKMVVENNACK